MKSGIVGAMMLQLVVLLLSRSEAQDPQLAELCSMLDQDPSLLTDATLVDLCSMEENYTGLADLPEKRKNEFVRFGKRKNEFVRFGKRKNEFVRFGRNPDKRKNEFVRFGKRKNEFVRFGRNPDNMMVPDTSNAPYFAKGKPMGNFPSAKAKARYNVPCAKRKVKCSPHKEKFLSWESFAEVPQ